MIEVGDFIRTDNGIIAQVINPNYYMEVYIECKEGLIIRDNIVKYSKDIIDLIEVGDYVNGKKIETILEPSIKAEYVAEKILCFETDYPIEKGLRYYHNCDIKSIVTKEVFAQAEYKIKEDK